MVTMRFVKVSRSFHAWGGFILSLMLILISLTGTLLVWKKEYLWLTIPEARSSDVLTPSKAAEVVLSAEKEFGKNDILLVQFGSERLSLNKVFLSDRRYAYLDNTGQLIDLWHLNERPEEWLYDLHHRLLLGNIGLLISGFAAICTLILLPLGLLAWWPTRQSFNWCILKSGLQRPQLLATHRNLGVFAILPIAILLITAIVLSFPEQSQRILVEPASFTDSYSALFEETSDQLSGSDQAEYEIAFTRALAGFEGAALTSVRVPNDSSSYVLMGIQQPGEWNSLGLSRVYIDKPSGFMDMRLDAKKLPMLEKLYHLNYPLHTGKTDRLWYRFFLTAVGLSLLALSVLGLWSFIKKLLAKKPLVH